VIEQHKIERKIQTSFSKANKIKKKGETVKVGEGV